MGNAKHHSFRLSPLLFPHFPGFECPFALVIAHLGRQRRKFNLLLRGLRGFTGVILVHFRRPLPPSCRVRRRRHGETLSCAVVH